MPPGAGTSKWLWTESAYGRSPSGIAYPSPAMYLSAGDSLVVLRPI